MSRRSARGVATPDALARVTVATVAGASASSGSGRRTIHDGGPDETSSVIVEPGATNEPPAGLCESTSPAGTEFEGPKNVTVERSVA